MHKVKLIDQMGDDQTPVLRARASYEWDKKTYTDEQNQKLLNRLIWEKHFWVLEGNSFTFMIETSIPIARQIMRHRTFSYNERSRRYLDGEHTPFEFDIPKPRGNKDQPVEIDENLYNQKYEEIYKKSLATYNELLKMGVAKETARYILPQGMMTRFYMTGNLRNWLHFLQLRCDPHSQKEVREVANDIKQIITDSLPRIMTAYKLSEK